MNEPTKEWLKAIEEWKMNLTLVRRFSKNTIGNYTHDIMQLARFMSARGIAKPEDVSDCDIEQFLCELYDCALSERSDGLKPRIEGDHIKRSTQSRALSAVKNFYKYMLVEDRISRLPTEFVGAPKSDRHLPDVLSIEEIDRALATFDTSTPLGCRNRAIVELLYSCGLRVSEAVDLCWKDIFADESMIRVVGKGDKQRIVPMSDESLMRINSYRAVRPAPSDAASASRVFLNRRGHYMTRAQIFNIVKQAVAEAGIEKSVSPHTLRHSFATHLLQGGANVRQIQELLGHESITTTEIYTHLDRSHLRKTIEDHFEI